MSSTAPNARYTWDDFVALDEDDLRWLVDADAQILQRLVLREGVYAIVESLAGDDVFRPASFEGLEIPLARLWEA